jgi:hypothetical protein
MNKFLPLIYKGGVCITVEMHNNSFAPELNSWRYSEKDKN